LNYQTDADLSNRMKIKCKLFLGFGFDILTKYSELDSGDIAIIRVYEH